MSFVSSGKDDGTRVCAVCGNEKAERTFNVSTLFCRGTTWNRTHLWLRGEVATYDTCCLTCLGQLTATLRHESYLNESRKLLDDSTNTIGVDQSS